MNYPRYDEKLERQKKLLEELQAESDNRPRRKMLGVQISENWGKSWKLKSLCEACVKSIEPPMQRRHQGASGTRTCDWCGAYNSELERK